MPKPHKYQADASEFAKEKKFSYIAADMGLGKTLIALTWATSIEAPVIIVSPLRGVYTTWPDEIKKWFPGTTYAILHGEDKDYAISRNVKFYITNYESLQWLFDKLITLYKSKKSIPFKAMIIDEGSMTKSWRTKRFKVLKQVRDLCTKGIIVLSGTPNPNSMMDLWSQYYILDKGKRLGSGITKFQTTFFDQNQYCRFKYDLKPGAEEQIYNLVKDITYRLDAADHNLDVPAKVDNMIKVPMPKEIKAKYKELEKNFLMELEDVTVTATFAAAKSMKLRQLVQGALYHDDQGSYKVIHKAKLDVLKSLVEEAGGQGILCPIQFRFEKEMIRKAFPEVPVIAGGEKYNITSLVKEWNKGNIPLLLCHPASLSHSVNMQQGSHLLVWYSLPWSLEQYLQLTARLHRQGQTKTVISHHLIMEGSIDEKVVKALTAKDKGMRSFLEALKR